MGENTLKVGLKTIHNSQRYSTFIETISFQIIGTLCTRIFRTFRYSETTVEQCNMYCYCTKYANLMQKIAAVQEYTQYYIKDGVCKLKRSNFILLPST